jgi:intraflagellar transport protein 81
LFRQFQAGVVKGDRKVIYPVLYYLLQRLPELQKRAYLAKYLVPLHIPEEMLADEDMKNLFQEYKDSQAEFQVSHQQLEEVQKDALVNLDNHFNI